MSFRAYGGGETRHYRDLEALLGYREYEDDWTLWFEEHWLSRGFAASGTNTFDSLEGGLASTTAAYRERVCELRRPGMPVEYYVYG